MAVPGAGYEKELMPLFVHIAYVSGQPGARGRSASCDVRALAGESKSGSENRKPGARKGYSQPRSAPGRKGNARPQLNSRGQKHADSRQRDEPPRLDTSANGVFVPPRMRPEEPADPFDAHASHQHADELCFADVRVPSSIRNGLEELGVRAPSPIQRLAIRSVYMGESIFMNAETGSGKTLAFLLPLCLQLLRLQHVSAGDVDLKWYGLILCPSRELALQIHHVCTKLLNSCSLGETPISARVLFGIDDGGGIASDDHILIATSGALFQLMDTNDNFRFALKRCVKYAVFDECDRMVRAPSKYATSHEKSKSSFYLYKNPAVQILNYLTEYSEGSLPPEQRRLQVIAASATMGRPFKRLFANIMHIRDMDRIPRTVSTANSEEMTSSSPPMLKVVMPNQICHIAVPVEDDEPDMSQRIAVLHSLLMHFKVKRCLVVLQPSESILSVQADLVSLGWKHCDLLSSAYGFESGNYSQTSVLAGTQQLYAQDAVGLDNAARIFLTTYGSTRGIDLAGLDHVFLLQAAPTMEEYQHAAGRTGRSNRSGTVVSILSWAEWRQLKSFQTPLQFRLQRLSLTDLGLV
ncbi:Pre-mRNA-processing ATP-dependent RNA helicase PRP5 [Porphyridium purpureum]|uniref:ATP-dependent RNA helicase n=1 Tax=Porphyridium purpureum TaxID=35688 RepID=A0A5J4Z6L2_PORPP|nr:Pre-mRNA-processing ATP-dependent RNA helicase PRP5 [Porphyridium purpureum]|eukprot:POR1300..scf295_1